MVFRHIFACVTIFLLVVMFTINSATAAAFQPDCSSPVSATKTLLKNLQDDNWDRVAASTCIQGDEKSALQLKQLLDAKGIFVDYSKIPTDPNFTNEQGQSAIAIDHRLSTIQWIKGTDGSWGLSNTGIQNIHSLYNNTFSPYVSALLDNLPATFFETILGYQVWQYLLFMIILTLSWIAGRLVDRVLYTQLLNFIERKKFKIDPTKLLPLRTPIVWLTISICFLGMIADLQLSIRSSQVLFFLSRLTLSISAVVLLSRLIDLLSEVFLARAEKTESKLDDQLIPLVKRAGKSLVWLLGIVFILQNMGVEVTALVAFGSVSGVAVALASKDTVENLFGSLVVFIDQPFQIGEYVIIDGSIEGVIEEVGFRSTRIRTLDKSLITVPNAKISHCTVNNFAKIPQRKFMCKLGVRYDTTTTQMEGFTDELRTYLINHEMIDDDTVLVYFTDMNSYSLDILVMAFINSNQWLDLQIFKHEAFLEFMKIAERHKVSFAFPTSTVELENQNNTP